MTFEEFKTYKEQTNSEDQHEMNVLRRVYQWVTSSSTVLVKTDPYQDVFDGYWEEVILA